MNLTVQESQRLLKEFTSPVREKPRCRFCYSPTGILHSVDCLLMAEPRIVLGRALRDTGDDIDSLRRDFRRR
jgi:hypothetical protein